MYKIKNLNKFAKTLGITVAKDADFSYNELRKYISVGNIKNIVRHYAKRDTDGGASISNEGIASCMSDIFDWIIGRDLATMAANDKLDCYWDDEKNEMVFRPKQKK